MAAPLCRIALLPDCHVSPQADEANPTHPVRRLYGQARMLLENYLDRLSNEVDAIFLLGDTLDPAWEEGVAWLHEQCQRCPVPVHVIIGNHESYGTISAEQFHRAMDLPDHGNSLIEVNGVPFFMLATPNQNSLAPSSTSYRWLEEQLQELPANRNLFCCAHYSLLLHPCVQGRHNDGMQVLWAADEILALLQKHPNMRAWIAGHKNVPSKLIQNGVLHLLSPQLIQAPCGYRILEIHAEGISSQTYGLQETELAEMSARAYGGGYEARHGHDEDRDFWWSWGPPS